MRPLGPRRTHGLHGTYAVGCRCAPCTAAHTKAAQDERRRLGVPARQPPEHGVSLTLLHRGCRCADCVALGRWANRQRWQARKRAIASGALKPPPYRHGRVSTYTSFGCRCPLCTKAQSVNQAKWRAAHREQANAISRAYRARKRAA